MCGAEVAERHKIAIQRCHALLQHHCDRQRRSTLTNDGDTDIKNRIVSERQGLRRAEMSGGANITYSYVQFSDRSHESLVPNTGQPWEPNRVALVKNGKEGSFFSGSKDRAGIRHPPPGSSYTYLGQKGI